MSVPATRPPRSRAERGFGQAIALFGLCLVLLLAVGIPAQVAAPRGGLAFTLVALLLLPTIVFVRLKRVGLRAGLRLEPIPPALAVASLAAGAGAWSLAVAVHQAVARLLGPPVAGGASAETAGAFAVSLAVGALLAGICEECLFRGVIQGVLERRGSWFAIVLAGVLFGLFHLDPWRILPAALLGCIFGWLTVRTRSVVSAIVAHAANNVTAISVAFLLGEPPAWLLALLAGAFVAGAAVVLARTAAPECPPTHPIASVPAGLPWPLAWLGGTAAALAAIVLVAAGLLFASLVTTVEMSDDALAPRIEPGDTLVLVRSGSFAFDPEGGDTVAFRRGDETLARVVLRREAGEVVVRHGGRELRVPPGDLVGELVHVVRRSAGDDAAD